ncbi:MAG: hypothetical protein ACE5GT_08660 [Rhodospirillales bacterium]
MLVEWIKHRLTPAPAHLKAMGYVRELIAMEARHRRCRAAWAPHLERCQALILKAAEGVGRGRVTVLGSGLLLDVPWRELVETFDELRLVDILHLPLVRKETASTANVRLIEADVTGVAEATYRHVEAGRDGSLPPPRADTGLYAASDLVVSANILTQLPLMPTAYLRDNAPTYGEDEIRAFARRIVEHHLELLAALPGRVALLTETRRVVVDGVRVLQEIDPLFGADVPRAGRHWTWDIAPRPELSRRYDLRFRMAGIPDLKAARAQP